MDTLFRLHIYTRCGKVGSKTQKI